MAAGWDRQGLRWVIATAAGALLAVGAVQAFQPTGPAVSLGAMPVRSFTTQITLIGEAKGSAPGATDVSKMLYEVPQGQAFLVQGLVVTYAAVAQMSSSLSACVLVDDTVVTCERRAMAFNDAGIRKSWTSGLRTAGGSKISIRLLGDPGGDFTNTPNKPNKPSFGVTLTGTLVRQ